MQDDHGRAAPGHGWPLTRRPPSASPTASPSIPLPKASSHLAVTNPCGSMAPVPPGCPEPASPLPPGQPPAGTRSGQPESGESLAFERARCIRGDPDHVGLRCWPAGATVARSIVKSCIRPLPNGGAGLIRGRSPRCQLPASSRRAQPGRVLPLLRGHLYVPGHSRRRRPQEPQVLAPHSGPGPAPYRTPRSGRCVPTGPACLSPPRRRSTACCSGSRPAPRPARCRTTRLLVPELAADARHGRVVDRFRQPAARHPRHVQLFDHHGPGGRRQARGQLVQHVLPDVAHSGVCPPQCCPGVFPVSAAFPPSG